MSGELKESPLREVHLELGGKLVPFAGWNMPIRYGSIIDEHGAVRNQAGVFDISHMGQFFVRGPGAGPWLDGLLTNSVGKLATGQGQYTFLLNSQGGVIDDLILYRSGDDEYFLVVNAAKAPEDLAWMQDRLCESKGVEIQDRSVDFAAMAVQGPSAPAVFAAMAEGRELPPRNGIEAIEIDGETVIVCRTGYTGEDGFEFFCPAASGAGWLRRALGGGAVACGLGARDTLRLEMCYPLNGSDLSPERTPLQAGLGFFVDLEKGEFTGREVLVKQKAGGLPSRLVAIQCLKKGPPIRAGAEVFSPEGEAIAVLTSGTLSPSLGLGIGMAYLPPVLAKIGQELAIDVRGRKIEAKVVKKPFYKKA